MMMEIKRANPVHIYIYRRKTLCDGGSYLGVYNIIHLISDNPFRHRTLNTFTYLCIDNMNKLQIRFLCAYFNFVR